MNRQDSDRTYRHCFVARIQLPSEMSITKLKDLKNVCVPTLCTKVSWTNTLSALLFSYLLVTALVQYSIPKDLSFTSVAYLFLYFLKSSMALISQNQQMDGSWVCYEQLGIRCNFNIPPHLPHLPISGEKGKLPQILPRNLMMPSFAQRVKTG